MLVKYIFWIVSIVEKFNLNLLIKENYFFWFKVFRGKVVKYVCYFGLFFEVWMKKNYIFYLMNKIGFIVLEYIWRFIYFVMGILVRKKVFFVIMFLLLCVYLLF